MEAADHAGAELWLCRAELISGQYHSQDRILRESHQERDTHTHTNTDRQKRE